MLVLLAGGGMFAYRQLKAIQTDAGARPTATPPTPVETCRVEVMPPAPPSTIGETWTPRPAPPPPQMPPDRSPAKKALIVAACLLWIVNPLDGDFIPFLGWIDDAFAGYIAYRTAWPKKD